MRGRKIVVLTLLCMLLFANLAVFASNDDMVLDQAALFSADEAEQVQETAEALADKIGASVHVVTLQDLGEFETLDAYEKELIQQHPSWQSPNGGRKSTLLLFVISMSPKELGIYYGETWKRAFEQDSEMRLMNDYMVPHFQSGDFAGGFVSAMQEAQRVLDAYLHPSKAGGAVNPTVRPTKTRPPAKTPVPTLARTSVPMNTRPIESTTNEADAKAFWSFFGFFLLFVFFVGIVALILFLLIRRKKIAQEREAARQEALRWRDSTSTVLNEIGAGLPEQIAVQKAKISTYSKKDPDAANELCAALEGFQKNSEQAAVCMANAASASATADDTNLVTSVYLELAKRYKEAYQYAEKAKKSVCTISEMANRIDEEIQSIGSTLEKSDEELAAIQETIYMLSKRNLKVTQEKVDLEQLRKRSAELKEKEAGETAIALKEIRGFTAEIKKQKNALATLESNDDKLRNGIPESEQRLITVRTHLEETKKVFETIKASYLRDSWKPIAGNGSRAEELLEKVAGGIRSTQEAYMAQNWEAALAGLAEIQSSLDDAMELLDAIVTMKKQLDAAKTRAQEEVSLAQIDIKKAADYEQLYDEDIDDRHKASIRKAQETLNQAMNQLALEMPNYFLVIELALKANHAADKILERCMSEHEQAERLRRQADSELHKAMNDFDKVARYIRNHYYDVGVNAQSRLAQAEGVLARARCATEAEEMLQYAKAAITAAKNAESAAKQDVYEAQAERDRVRRAEAAAERDRRRREKAEAERDRKRKSEAEATVSRSRHSNQSSSYSRSSHSSSGGGGGSSRSFSGSSGGGGGSSRGW